MLDSAAEKFRVERSLLDWTRGENLKVSPER